MKTKHQNNKIAHVVVHLTLLTGSLRIQLWSQDRGSYTKTNREQTRSEKNKTQTNKQEIKQAERSGLESSLQMTSSPGRDSGGKAKEQKTNKSEINKGQPHVIRVGQERQPYNKQCKTTQIRREKKK